MWELKIGSRPAFTSASEASSRGRTKPSSLSWGQWSVCRAMFTEYFLATSRANAAKASEPATMSFTEEPEK